MNETWAKYGLWLAGFANIGGVLLFSRGLTNDALFLNDPVVMSRFGLVMIIVWGLAYVAAASKALEHRWIVGVFALEKAVYVGVWMLWMIDNGANLGSIYSDDILAGIFFSIYGLNDLAFLLLFVMVFRAAKAPAAGQ